MTSKYRIQFPSVGLRGTALLAATAFVAAVAMVASAQTPSQFLGTVNRHQWNDNYG